MTALRRFCVTLWDIAYDSPKKVLWNTIGHNYDSPKKVLWNTMGHNL
jgi:hypothetical protein